MSLNRISVVVPGTSSTAAAQRDEAIAKLISSFSIGTNYDTWHYTDSNSGMYSWGYYFYGYSYVDGITTIATVTCTGILHPPSGSDLVSSADPGLGTAYTWGTVGAPLSIRTSSGVGGGGSVPQGNNNFYVWNIPGNSSAAATDFTTAVTAIESALAGSLLGGAIVKKYLKYTDSVSGAWQFSAIYFGAGCAEFGSTSSVAVLPNNNILYVVTCSGTPNPPTGSSAPAVSVPSFTQTGIVTITAPLSFGPMR